MPLTVASGWRAQEGRQLAHVREIFQAAVRALGVDAAKILLVGDSLQDDVEAAMRAGLAAALIDRRNRHEEVKHVPRISSLKDLLLLVDGRR